MKKGLLLVGVGVALLALAGVLVAASVGDLASDWAYEMTGIRAVQKRGLDGTGVKVAVIDTGIDPGHPSLDGVRIAGWKDLVGGRPQPYDDQGHGSHIAGVLAGQGTNFLGKLQGFDMRGAAPGASLVVVKAIAADGTGTADNVAAGIAFAVAQRADVVCLSLGSKASELSLFGDQISRAVDDAVDHGIPVVAAAGNTGQRSDRHDVESPASLLDVVAVGAVDEDKRVAAFSARGDAEKNYGRFGIAATAERTDPDKKPELVAPGVKIQSAWKGGAYVRADGTSQAAPFVCGALALAFQAKPALKNDNSASLVHRVKQALMQAAEPVPGQQAPHDPRAGYGLLRADRLLDRL